ncbi:MAG: SAM-dependent methyltransferase [Candidatus Marinimicrobia bacterium]|nr:SAM-dependent methyltransferase [Candidatus Neomarinimicrobiota bacterium]
MEFKRNNNSKKNKEEFSEFWENIYLEGDAGWDLGGPTPAFVELSNNLKKGKVCIIGCGRGYDSIVFAKKGFKVTAVDFAPTAISSLNKMVAKENVNVRVIKDDIFNLLPQFQNYYDYVIEQTCFCAIHRSRRKEYEILVKGLLKRDGLLVGLWFPMDKSIDEGGPPYGVTEKEVKSIFQVGWEIIKEEFSEFSVKPRIGREKLIIFKNIDEK